MHIVIKYIMEILRNFKRKLGTGTLDPEAVNEHVSHITKAINGEVTRLTLVDVTGELRLIRHGNMIYFMGEYINTKNAQRVCNIPKDLSPKENLEIPLLSGNIQINNGIVTHWGQGGIKSV